MNNKDDALKEKQVYEAPRVLASYDKEELEDVVGVSPEVHGQYETGGGGCGCGGGSIIVN